MKQLVMVLICVVAISANFFIGGFGTQLVHAEEAQVASESGSSTSGDSTPDQPEADNVDDRDTSSLLEVMLLLLVCVFLLRFSFGGML